MAQAQALAKRYTGDIRIVRLTPFSPAAREQRRMREVMLDTSALLAMLKGERGAAKVAGAIAGE